MALLVRIKTTNSISRGSVYITLQKWSLETRPDFPEKELRSTLSLLILQHCKDFLRIVRNKATPDYSGPSFESQGLDYQY